MHNADNKQSTSFDQILSNLSTLFVSPNFIEKILNAL